jgi:DNA-binding winged helix-turn-helix (wHTH) protein
MEWTASPGSIRPKERFRVPPLGRHERSETTTARGQASAGEASAHPETSTLVSIYRCDSEMRVSEVIYSDHVADAARFIGTTDYDVLSSEEADVVMALKWRAFREQRQALETLTLTWDGASHTLRIAVFPERDRSSGHSVTVVVTEILNASDWLRMMDLPVTPSPEAEIPRIGFVRMDNSTRTLLGPVRNVHLSGTEWRLLRQLSNAHGGVVSHEQLLSAIWGSGYSTAHHLLHDAVSRLRHRFLAAGVERAPIETVHGVGYRLNEEGEVF